MLNASETQHHLAIVDLITKRKNYEITEGFLKQMLVGRLQGGFRERCNCGELLVRVPEEGRAFVCCMRCKHRHWEYRT